MTTIDGAVTVVTGASRGIGVPLARALAERGAKLALAARSEDELVAVRDELAAGGATAIAVVCDVASIDDRARLVATVEQQLGPIDILVNNAGIEVTRAFVDTDADALSRILEVNLDAPMQLTRMVLPGMIERGRGHVVNMSSAGGKIGAPYLAAYSASKFGLVGLTQALRAEYPDSPVKFSVVCPAFVTGTGMYARWAEQGVRSPALAGTASIDRVVAATVRCISKDKAEVIVNRPPLKPTVLLATAAPGVVPKLLKALGYTKAMEAASRLQQ